MEIKAEVITIGDEILYGQIVDTNSQWISTALDGIGVRVIRKTAIGDKAGDILAALRQAEASADIVIVTGGLGPTRDDITKATLAQYYDSPLAINDEALAQIMTLFSSRGKKMFEGNRLQANLPTKAKYLPNRMGTAPGMMFEENGTLVFSLPGVPYEMKALMSEEVLPIIIGRFKLPVLYHRVIRTAGVGESQLAERILKWEESLPAHIGLAYLPSLSQVKLRLTAIGIDRMVLEKEVKDQEDQLTGLIGEHIYGHGDEEPAQGLGKVLLEKGLTIAIAESCTGGFLSHLVTATPGCSQYYLGSIVSYDNELKMGQLEVRPELIERHGAVSEEVVRAMAEGVRQKFGADIGISTSGIAGPGGGSPEKPVGLVWTACASADATVAWKLQLGKDRRNNIDMASVILLDRVRRFLGERS